MGRHYICAQLSELPLSFLLLIFMLLKVLRNGGLVLRRLWPYCAAPGSAQGQPCSCQGASAGRGLCGYRDTVGGAQPTAVTRLHRAAHCCLPRPRWLRCSPPGPSSRHPRCAWLGHIYWLPVEADVGLHLGCDLLVCLPLTGSCRKDGEDVPFSVRSHQSMGDASKRGFSCPSILLFLAL